MLLPPQRHPEPAEPHRQRPDGRVRGSLHRWTFLYHTRMSVIAAIRLARLICRTGGNGLERRRTAAPRPTPRERKSAWEGKRVSERVSLGGRRSIQTKNITPRQHTPSIP